MERLIPPSAASRPERPGRLGPERVGPERLVVGAPLNARDGVKVPKAMVLAGVHVTGGPVTWVVCGPLVTAAEAGGG